MAQSLARVYLHIVFSTRERRPWLVDGGVRTRLFAKLAALCGANGSPALQVGGVEDHVHVLCCLGRTVAISDLVKEIKRGSSIWLKTQSPDLEEFDWQAGYGAFSISPSHQGAVETYIRRQEERHREQSFQDEFRHLLNKYEVDFDEKYVWG